MAEDRAGKGKDATSQSVGVEEAAGGVMGRGPRREYWLSIFPQNEEHSKAVAEGLAALEPPVNAMRLPSQRFPALVFVAGYCSCPLYRHQRSFFLGILPEQLN